MHTSDATQQPEEKSEARILSVNSVRVGAFVVVCRAVYTMKVRPVSIRKHALIWRNVILPPSFADTTSINTNVHIVPYLYRIWIPQIFPPCKIYPLFKREGWRTTFFGYSQKTNIVSNWRSVMMESREITESRYFDRKHTKQNTKRMQNHSHTVLQRTTWPLCLNKKLEKK